MIGDINVLSCLYVDLSVGLFAVNTYSTQFYNIFLVTIIYKKKVKQYFTRFTNDSFTHHYL